MIQISDQKAKEFSFFESTDEMKAGVAGRLCLYEEAGTMVNVSASSQRSKKTPISVDIYQWFLI